MGGIGNQLFQAAHAIAQGKKYNREVVFVPKSWTPMQGRQTEAYLKNIFRNLKFVDNIEHFQKVGEGPWEYSEVSPIDGDTVFDGYFQSGKNFLNYDKEIQELFSPTKSFINEILIKYPELGNKNTLSIHVRKGDYLENPDIHPSVSVSYILKSLELVGDYSHIFIFSDDKEWVKNNIVLNNVTYVNEDEDYKELWMMSLCSNNIICNSTFSWWGSFLNKNSNKKIIAPSLWFGPRGPRNHQDIFQSYWTIINVEYKNGELIYVA
jgi:hypothetical protein